MSLGLKQTLGDPWVDAGEKFAVGSQVEGPVTSFTKFGAFVQLVEGVEGMIHVSEISAEKRVERVETARAEEAAKWQHLTHSTVFENAEAIPELLNH